MSKKPGLHTALRIWKKMNGRLARGGPLSGSRVGLYSTKSDSFKVRASKTLSMAEKTTAREGPIAPRVVDASVGHACIRRAVKASVVSAFIPFITPLFVVILPSTFVLVSHITKTANCSVFERFTSVFRLLPAVHHTQPLWRCAQQA